MNVAEADREFLVAEALALADQLPRGDQRSSYQEIAWAADQGEVPDDLGEHVGELVALSLETGRARAVHGPAGVRALVSVWRATPQARRLGEELEELNAGLSSLRGREIDGVRVAAAGPGAYSLSIGAGEVEVRITVDRAGARLRSVNVGGGGIGE